jgi:cbb3-type cytochrome c oxidase subunit III
MGNPTGDVRHGRVVFVCLIVMLVATYAWSQESMRWIEDNPATIAKGKALFATCGACHGMQGEGRQGIGPRLNSETFLAAASDDLLVQTISQGRAGTTMIPWGASFKAEDIQSIVAYIRSLNPAPAATLNESPLNGDATRGAELYATICAACHGKSGAGYQETANGTGIGRAAFLDSVSNGFLRYIIKHGKSGTPMRPFDKDSKVAVANLTDQQVDDVIAHLRSQSW